MRRLRNIRVLKDRRRLFLVQQLTPTFLLVSLHLQSAPLSVQTCSDLRQYHVQFSFCVTLSFILTSLAANTVEVKLESELACIHSGFTRDPVIKTTAVIYFHSTVIFHSLLQNIITTVDAVEW